MMSELDMLAAVVDEVVESFFDDDSRCGTSPPRIVILMGGPAAGKTTIRQQSYASGYVVVDAAEVFLRLCRGQYLPFPDGLEGVVNLVGKFVTLRALAERRAIVTEILGADFHATTALIDAMTAIGYKVELQAVTCDLDQAQERNLTRGPDSISAYFTEAYQMRWLTDAGRRLFHRGDVNAGSEG